MEGDLTLREVTESDLATFFEYMREPAGIQMAAFTAPDPHDREAFMTKWKAVLVDPTVTWRAIVYRGQLAGSVLTWDNDGVPEVSYWLGGAWWGKGLATAALDRFLAEHQDARPIQAHVASDNRASLRILEKCGFKVVGLERGYANGRGMEIEEIALVLER
jgi:RimJ/RimL family protein N-acetyltransferase